MSITLQAIASATAPLGGRIQGDHVSCRLPGDPPHRNRKVTIWPRPDGGISINIFDGQADVMAVKRELERMCGIDWKRCRDARKHQGRDRERG